MAHAIYRHEVRISGDLDMKIINDFARTIAKKWVAVKEAGSDTGNLHVHLGLQLAKKVRSLALVAQLADALGIDRDHIRVRPMASNKGYCQYVMKADHTLVDGPYVDGIKPPEEYDGADVICVERDPRPFQKEIMDLIDSTPDTRTVYWYWEESGNVGKSALVKYLEWKDKAVGLDVAKAHQLKAAAFAMGPQRAYLLDMPRTVGKDDSIRDCMCVIEALKNGRIIDVMYGRSNRLLMKPPHVICFANYPPPREMLSGDRWVVKHIEL